MPMWEQGYRDAYVYNVTDKMTMLNIMTKMKEKISNFILYRWIKFVSDIFIIILHKGT